MKELIKVVVKKLFILSIIFNTIYSLADYGEAYVLSYFGTSPLTFRQNNQINNMDLYYRYNNAISRKNSFIY